MHILPDQAARLNLTGPNSRHPIDKYVVRVHRLPTARLGLPSLSPECFECSVTLHRKLEGDEATQEDRLSVAEFHHQFLKEINLLSVQGMQFPSVSKAFKPFFQDVSLIFIELLGQPDTLLVVPDFTHFDDVSEFHHKLGHIVASDKRRKFVYL